MKHKQQPNKRIRHILSIPFIYGLLPLFLVLDLCIEIYHHVCFHLYTIPLIVRQDYIKIDRHKLQQLSPVERLNCAYCGYVNGLLHYVVEIGAQSENYWCGIKH